MTDETRHQHPDFTCIYDALVFWCAINFSGQDVAICVGALCLYALASQSEKIPFYKERFAHKNGDFCIRRRLSENGEESGNGNYIGVT